MSLRLASILALDLNCPPASLELAVEFCRRLAEMTMMLAPHNEMALVLAGTRDSHNPLHHAHCGDTDGTRFKHISVPCALAAPTVEFLEPLVHLAATPPPPCERHAVDFLEILLVSDQVMRGRTANKCYQRVVYLLTDASTDVLRKDGMNSLLQSFQQQGVTLVVIGIDFTEPLVEAEADADERENSDEHLAGLSVKAQNERVLRFMCSLLGKESTVVSLADALRGVEELQGRTITQRPLLRVILTVGDVRLATQMFTKAQEERLPTLKKTTPSGEEICMRTIFQGLSEDATPLQQKDLRKGYYYGRSLVPCSEEDAETMKIKGPRALDALGFVPLQQVPVYVLLGGVKVITPLADDFVGAKAFRSIVRAMAAAGKAMIVRFVRTRDADPVLGLCVPSTKEQRDVLFFSPLPFAEDVRFFDFSDYEGVRDDDDDAAEEARLVAAIVEEMTVGKEVLRPCKTFNPVLQQYYATLRAKLRRCAESAATGGNESREVGDAQEEANGGNTAAGEVLLPLVHALHATSATYGMPGNQLEPMHSSVRAKLEACARSFVYVSNSENCVTEERRTNWSHSSAGSREVAASDVSSRAPSTVATPCFVAGASHIMTIDPVCTFQKMVQSREGVKVLRAMDELVDTVFKLLRWSLKDAQYAKGTECVLLLRQHCLEAGEADYFNKFLLKLMLIARELDHESFWHNGVVARGVAPITRLECPNSTIADEEAARQFLMQDRRLPAPPLEDPDDAEVLNMIV
ncbi:putative KU80 protein [Trypanosoma rangeli]|uniref:Putative KU80 protein n=1 Tax=Trypanosoma rangeli TaxID=5698 RepID=A0A422NMK3_TRYRA|nr:putative KU80 protein [Trypanosoma rangeli]RNF06728.1 putative KU80 protein [Trypanosoma rangeli]|eukprot:RNF06728.1 putative KU80 protein [Trypanosoma rangeli]